MLPTRIRSDPFSSVSARIASSTFGTGRGGFGGGPEAHGRGRQLGEGRGCHPWDSAQPCNRPQLFRQRTPPTSRFAGFHQIMGIDVGRRCGLGRQIVRTPLPSSVCSSVASPSRGSRFRPPSSFSVREEGTVHSLSLIHISEPTRLRRTSYAVFCLKKKKKQKS